MARWKPDAAQRLMASALELFEERGYDGTTVQAIAERAELTKSAFFRYFADKREALFDGESMAATLVEGIASAPEDAGAWDALRLGLRHVGDRFMTGERHGLLARRAAVIARTPELGEREALKKLGLIQTMVAALGDRGVADLDARVLSEFGALLFEIAYTRWLSSAGQDFADVLADADGEVRAVAARWARD